LAGDVCCAAEASDSNVLKANTKRAWDKKVFKNTSPNNSGLIRMKPEISFDET